MILPIVTLLALAAADPCAPVEPARPPDPSLAAEYRAVAEAEASAGRRETEVTAWRSAASLDPADPRARTALKELCLEARKPAPTDPLPEAIRLFDAGRYRDAAELLATLRRARPSAEAALLEGICRYELGADGEAARLLREAELDPDHRAMAQLYLGLVALRGGSASEAAALLSDAQANPGIASFAGELTRAARWDGPWLVQLQAEGGWDSNVTLTSDGLGPAKRSSALGDVSALAVARPFGANGLYARGAGVAQKYTSLDSYDFTGLEGGAGVRWWRGGTGATGEYAAATRTLGGSSYLTTHQLSAVGALALGPIALAGSWSGRWEDYASAWSGFSGFAQHADGRVRATLGAHVRLGLGWSWGRDRTDDSVFTWSEQGPRADLGLLVGPRTRVLLEAGWTVRTYDEVGQAPGVKQRDEIAEGGAALEHDLGSRTTLRLGLVARNSSSNVPGFSYFKIVPTAALSVAISP